MEYRTENTYAPASALEIIASLRSALGQVMRIENHTIHQAPLEVIEFSGQLTRPSDEAFDIIYDRFTALGYTPMLTQKDGKEVVIAQHGIVQPTANNNRSNVILLVLTIASTLLAGASFFAVETELGQRVLSPNMGDMEVLVTLFRYPTLWLSGVPYALTLLSILGVHEMGHYVAARIHRAAVTLPYFIPMPFGLGTMGAVIRLKSPIKNRRQLFDIGVAGPLAGLAIAIPLVIVGLITSPVQSVSKPAFQEGNSILYALLKFVIKGQFLPSNGYDVNINAILFPAWFGLVVTMINLLPIGQLDGGHVLYALFGRRQWQVATVMTLVLLGLGIYTISITGQILNVWLIWALLTQVFGLRHPPPLDDITPLDGRRKLIGYATIIIFILIFTPIPFS